MDVPSTGIPMEVPLPRQGLSDSLLSLVAVHAPCVPLPLADPDPALFGPGGRLQSSLHAGSLLRDHRGRKILMVGTMMRVMRTVMASLMLIDLTDYSRYS